MPEAPLENITPLSDQTLRHVFGHGFTAGDLAEPLASFDESTSGDAIAATMTRFGYQVVGLQRDGLVVGYLHVDDLGSQPCGDYMRYFDRGVLPNTAPLSEVVLALRDQPRCFVSILGRVGGILTKTDLQKPPARMWLFGMITLIEMRFTRLLEIHCPDESWCEFLSEGRVAKARQLVQERSRRNQSVDLLSCLQMSDKLQIIGRNEKLRSMTRFQSRHEIERVAKSLEKLRNNLAHSQDIIVGDWDTIVLLTENLEFVLTGPSGLS